MGNPIPGATTEDRALAFLSPLLNYCGPMKLGALYAILEHETKMGKNVNGAGTAKLGAALGPWQVMTAYLADYGLNSTTVFDPEVSTKRVCAKLLKVHDYIMAKAPEADQDLPLYAYLLYVGHNAGLGGLIKILTRTLAANQHPITVESVRPLAAAYVGTTARESGYYAVAYGSTTLNERGAAAWQQWVAPAEKVYEAPSPWVTPMLLTATGLVAIALAAAIYAERSGSRSPLVHWSPRYA